MIQQCKYSLLEILIRNSLIESNLRTSSFFIALDSDSSEFELNNLIQKMSFFLPFTPLETRNRLLNRSQIRGYIQFNRHSEYHLQMLRWVGQIFVPNFPNTRYPLQLLTTCWNSLLHWAVHITQLINQLVK